MKKLCLVLGANGFVGSHLVDKLAQEADLNVRAFDRFSRKPQFRANANVNIHKGDITNDDDIAKALKDVTYVIHCISTTTPFIADNDPYADVHNLSRSIKIFELCVLAGVKKIAFISSGGSVYGRLAEQRTATEMDAPMPVSPYGIGKLAIEHYLEYFKRKHSLEYVAYRLTNPYGPRQIVKNSQGVIAHFSNSLLQAQPITIYGDGNSSRDYIYIDDAVDMIVRSFREPNKHSVYNIGSGRQTTLNEIIDTLKQLLNKEAKVEYRPEPKTFLLKTNVSIERFVEEFGAANFVSFREGVARMLGMHQTDQSL